MRRRLVESLLAHCRHRLCVMPDRRHVRQVAVVSLRAEAFVALDADQIHTPGIFVHRIVLNATPEKRIEKRRKNSSGGGPLTVMIISFLIKMRLNPCVH